MSISGVAPRAQVVNEVLLENRGAGPIDVGGELAPMIELFNPTDEVIELGGSSAETSYFLAFARNEEDEESGPHFDPKSPYVWRFPEGRAALPARGRRLLFADGDYIEAACELHTTFALDTTGGVLTLWGPELADGVRPVIDRIWVPALPPDVSFGRHPDGAGPAPVPTRATYDTFHVFALGYRLGAHPRKLPIHCRSLRRTGRSGPTRLPRRSQPGAPKQLAPLDRAPTPVDECAGGG